MNSNPTTEPEVRYSAFVARGRLCVLGVANTSCGPIPLASYADIEGESEDGPVGDDAPANVKGALDKALQPIQSKIQQGTMRAGAEALVLRARARDQNALAILALIGERARAGNKRAQIAAAMIEQYCKSNPEIPLEIGDESSTPNNAILKRIVQARSPAFAYPLAIATYIAHAPPDMRTVVCLANGPHLTMNRIFEIASKLATDDEGHSFMIGFEHTHNPDALSKMAGEVDETMIRSGRMVGQARAIQRYRVDQQIGKFCADSAWEMGE